MKEIKNFKPKESKVTDLFLILVAFLLVFILFNSVRVSADAPKIKLTDDQRGELSMNCSSIKSSLKKLQVSDAKIRSLLGANYQTILNSYITPFNLRLVKITRISAIFLTYKVVLSCKKMTLVHFILLIVNNLKISFLLIAKKILTISTIS